MVHAENLATPYAVQFGNGNLTAIADTASSKGGGGAGFRPHELLEAALATCMTMTVRMYAERHGIDHAGIGIEVSLDRSKPECPYFECKVNFPETGISLEKRVRMLEILDRCPVHQTLAAGFRFNTVVQG
jgi:putative redox protein